MGPGEREKNSEQVSLGAGSERCCERGALAWMQALDRVCGEQGSRQMSKGQGAQHGP